MQSNENLLHLKPSHENDHWNAIYKGEEVITNLTLAECQTRKLNGGNMKDPSKSEKLLKNVHANYG